ncbi:MAG: SGNH/GDSL hydrolase family protein [Spirosomataceae bacterium]
MTSTKQPPRIKTFLALLVGYFLLGFVSTTAGQGIPKNVRRILFLGNSITYSGAYITNIEAYFAAHYPNQSVEFINVGLPSETVAGLSEDGHAGGRFPRPDLHERLGRVLEQTKPDWVFACYGINDGIQMPLDESRFQRFKDGIVWLHEEVTKMGARIIHLTPSVYDETRGKSKGYAAVMDYYAKWLVAQHKQQHWEVIDTHTPMKKYIDAHQKLDKKLGIAGFTIAPDGVHINDAGHWIVAKEVLLYLGEKAVATVPDIQSALSDVSQSVQILDLVTQRQAIMKDAWLTATRHTRPEMKTGLPMQEARKKYDEIGQKIQDLRKQ